MSHFDWYETTGYKVPYTGEKVVRQASDLKNALRTKADADDD